MVINNAISAALYFFRFRRHFKMYLKFYNIILLSVLFTCNISCEYDDNSIMLQLAKLYMYLITFVFKCTYTFFVLLVFKKLI